MRCRVLKLDYIVRHKLAIVYNSIYSFSNYALDTFDIPQTLCRVDI